MKKFSFLLTFLICQLGNAQNYNVTKLQQCNSTTGGTEIVTFLNTPPNASSDGTLSVTYDGDLNSISEFIQFFGENSTLLGQTSTIGQCTGSGLFTTTIPMANIISWAGDGQIVITAVSSSGVNNICTGNSFCVTMQLQYGVITGPNDVGVASINFPASLCSGTKDITVTIQNYGTNQVNSVNVNWALNNVIQAPFTFSGMLDTTNGAGSNTGLVTLGSHNFVAGTPVNIKAWTANPNGFTDTINVNDSSEIDRTPLQQAIISDIQNDDVCEFGDLNLGVTSNANNILWYDDPAITNQVGTGPSLLISNATSTQTRYVRGMNVNGCNTPITTVVGTVSQTPVVAYTYVVNGGTVDFTSVITGPFDSLNWDFADGDSSNTLNPSHTFTSTGTRLVTLTAYEGSCIGDTSSAIFVVAALGLTSLENEIRVYPNPSKGRFLFEIPQNGAAIKIEIINLDGQVVHEVEMAGNAEWKPFDLTALPAGNYFLKLIRGEQLAYKRISIF
jgi:Secretion system C-terminal sorting domain/Ig-like domain CHU_C associated